MKGRINAIKLPLFLTGLATLFGVGAFLFYQHEIRSYQQQYREQKDLEISRVIDEIDTKLSYLYQSMRTMSFIPGVKRIDRYGKNLDDNTKMTLQQLFNNAYINIRMSEIYLLPPTMDPEKVDPNTQKTEEPITTFDEFRMTLKPEGEQEEKPELEEVEEFEYRLMKNQLEFLQSKFPTSSTFKDLDVPLVSGAPVVTCDNTQFTAKDLQSGNNGPRMGLVFTVPTYSMNGQFHGAVSSVVRTQVLRSFLPDYSIGLYNANYGALIAKNEDSAEWRESLPFFKEGKPNPNIAYSSVHSMKFPDVNTWQIWVAYPEAQFWESEKILAMKRNLFASIAIATIFLFALGSRLYQRQRLSSKVSVIASGVGLGSTKLNFESNRIKVLAESLRTVSGEQAKASQQVASAVTQISAMVSKTDELANELAESAQEGIKSSELGQASVESLVDNSGSLAKSVELLVATSKGNAQQMAEVGGLFDSIAVKTKMIDDLVFQTKLLSFNASVEAARAGEAGKGFSVVAEEIGGLAKQSGTSAQEINQVIEEARNRIAEITKATEISVTKIEKESESQLSETQVAASKCRTSMDSIREKIFEFSTMAGEILVASKEQRKGVEEIATAINQISVASQNTTQASEDVLGVSINLQGQANLFQSEVTNLTFLIGDKTNKNTSKAA